MLYKYKPELTEYYTDDMNEWNNVVTYIFLRYYRDGILKFITTQEIPNVMPPLQ